MMPSTSIAESLLRTHVPSHTSEQARTMQGLPAHQRGFWTDEELLEASGLKSVAVLKKIAGTRWLQPSYGSSPDGGRRRIWTFADVVRAGVVAEIAARASLPLISVGLVLHRATSTWVEAGIGLKHRIWALAHDHGLAPLGNAGYRLVILDGVQIWAETTHARFELISSGAVLTGPEVIVPSAKPSTFASLDQLNDGAVSTLIITLSNLELPIFGSINERLRDGP